MDSKKNNNEFLKGSLRSSPIKLALPVLIGQLLIVAYGFVDSFFVSMIDKKSTALISAIGIVFPVYFIFIAIGLGMSGGLSSLVARALGEKNESVLERTGGSGLFLAMLISTFAMIAFYSSGCFIVNMLSGTAVTEATRANALSFLNFIIPGFAFLIMFQTLSGILQGEGSMNFPAMGMILSVVLNVLLDPLFIFVFKMGISGAGLATSISIFISFCFLLVIFLTNKSVTKIHFHVSRISLKQVKEIIRVGAPQTLNMILLSVSFMIINYCVGSIGEDVLNAWTLVGRLDDFILMIGYALAASTITLTGQNYGSNNLERVKKAFRINIYYALAGSIMLALVYNIFAVWIFGALTDNKSVFDHCIQQVRLISFSYTGVVASIILNSLFLGTGRPLPGLILNFIRMYIVALPLCFIFVFIFNFGILTVILLFASVNMLTLLSTFIWANIYLKNLKHRMILQ